MKEEIKTAKYDETSGLVIIEAPQVIVLSPQQTYELYVAIRAILPELPQPFVATQTDNIT